MTRTLELFLGDRVTFTVTSTPANTSQTYNRFSDMADDVVNVRIYQGIHFRTADEVARRQGTRSADWAFSHFLRLVDDDECAPCAGLPERIEHRARSVRRCVIIAVDGRLPLNGEY